MKTVDCVFCGEQPAVKREHKAWWVYCNNPKCKYDWSCGSGLKKFAVEGWNKRMEHYSKGCEQCDLNKRGSRKNCGKTRVGGKE